MAQFKALAPGVEVLGEVVLSLVNVMGAFKGISLEILKDRTPKVAINKTTSGANAVGEKIARGRPRTKPIVIAPKPLRDRPRNKPIVITPKQPRGRPPKISGAMRLSAYGS